MKFTRFGLRFRTDKFATKSSRTLPSFVIICCWFQNDFSSCEQQHISQTPTPCSCDIFYTIDTSHFIHEVRVRIILVYRVRFARNLLLFIVFKRFSVFYYTYNRTRTRAIENLNIKQKNRRATRVKQYLPSCRIFYARLFIITFVRFRIRLSSSLIICDWNW